MFICVILIFCVCRRGDMKERGVRDEKALFSYYGVKNARRKCKVIAFTVSKLCFQGVKAMLLPREVIAFIRQNDSFCIVKETSC